MEYLIASLAALTGAAIARLLSPQAMNQINAITAEKAGRSASEKKLQSSLVHLIRETSGKKAVPGASRVKSRVKREADGRVSGEISAVPSDDLKNAFTAAITCCLLSGASPLIAATTAGTDDAAQAKLAMELNNPVAALISVPLQSNWDFGIGPNDACQYTLKVQPVIPIKLNEDWNIISRTIVPIIDAESPAPGIKDVSGLGVSTQSFFLSPEKKTRSGLIWGAGPVIMIPTATDDLLGSNQWGAGPTALVLKQQDGWTYGMLANQLWSFHAGNDATNATYLQPFVSYTTHTHTSFALNTESSYDWRNDQWSIPLNLMVSQLVKIGKLPVQFQVGGRYYAEAPDGGPDWGLRFAVTFLLP